MAELKKKIKQTNNDANGCDKDIRSLQENQKEISTELEDKQSKVYQLQSAVDEADVNIDKLTDERQRVSPGKDIFCVDTHHLFILDSSICSKLFFLEVQQGSSLIDPVLLPEET